MREPVDAPRLQAFMKALGRAGRRPAQVYFTGGASAVLEGWRLSSIDLDLKLVPDHGELFAAIPRIKEELHMNVELASPSDFIPELPGWRERSPFIALQGPLSFHHYDFYAQALAKLERGHDLDLADVSAMKARKLVEGSRLLEFLAAIEPGLVRYPAVDPRAFRRRVEKAARSA